MGKITFRADDDLVDELEAFDASKSEVMREALRTYLDAHAGESAPSSGPTASGSPSEIGTARTDDHAVDRSETIDDLVRRRVDEHLERRMSDHRRGESQDVNVTVSLEGAEERLDSTASAGRTSDARDGMYDGVESRNDAETRVEGPDGTPSARDERGGADGPERTCGRCGETVDGGHVYCPNCGEKASKRVFCECGDEIRSDWSFCPGCGRRTPAADVLDSH